MPTDKEKDQLILSLPSGSDDIIVNVGNIIIPVAQYKALLMKGYRPELIKGMMIAGAKQMLQKIEKEDD